MSIKSTAFESLETVSVKTLSFNYRYAPCSINVNFNVPGAAIESLQGTDLLIQNLTTGELITGATASYNVIYRNWTVTFPSSPFGAPPDGEYRVTLPAGSISDGHGNPLESDATLEFFFLNADANRDRIVDTQDFNLLAASFGYNTNFDWGDFTYDGVVDSADFNVLVSQFGKKLVPTPTVAVPPIFGEMPVGDTAFNDDWL